MGEWRGNGEVTEGECGGGGMVGECWGEEVGGKVKCIKERKGKVHCKTQKLLRDKEYKHDLHN